MWIQAWIVVSSLLFLIYGVVGWRRAADSFERKYSLMMGFMSMSGFAVAGLV